MRAAEEARRLAGELHDVVERVRQRDIGKQVRAGTESERDGRTECRHAARVVHEQFLIASGGRAAGERLNRGGVVVPHRVVQSANEGRAIEHPRESRQVFADADAGNGGGDGAVLAANLGGRSRAWGRACRGGSGPP